MKKLKRGLEQTFGEKHFQSGKEWGMWGILGRDREMVGRRRRITI